MKEDFTVPMDGLAQGRTEFRRHAGKEFFAQFENSEILDADLTVGVAVEKSGRWTGVDCEMEGTMTVPCDRCFDDLVLPVSTGFRLSVKFGGEAAEASGEMEGEREIVCLNDADGVLDLSQIVYDYACLSLPTHRVHAADGCNPAALRFLNSEVAGEPAADGTEMPFASLRKLMDNKQE